MYSDNREVNSASASTLWYAFKSCANSGVHCAFNLRVLATMASEASVTLISGIFKVPVVSSKSPRLLSPGWSWKSTEPVTSVVCANTEPVITKVTLFPETVVNSG